MSSPPVHTTAPQDRVSWNQLVAYGVGGVIPIALFNIAGQLTQVLGNISLGLSAFWLGVIMIIPRLWDAVSDPLMGHITDNSRTKWGRRRPYILLGGIGVAVSFVGMWWIPRGDDVQAWFGSEASYNLFQLASILAGLLVFFTACTVFEIPHGALGMEMSPDYHERTRLFSSKSFMGNLFAMATPWLFALAGWEIFRGPGGDLVDGMRYVSLFIAVALVPLSLWWFFALKEPGFEVVKTQAKQDFWKNMSTALGNRTFLQLVAIIFVLAMAFDIVTIFGAFYITIFYLYEGDAVSAGNLLGITGTVWGVTGLLAVFPLNWLSRLFGKNTTLLLAIGLMCLAQLSKIVCYNPELPYLVIIPTIFLSSGMLMFFTLGYSMVGDICDEDELNSGTRSEGSYYSIYWWIIKTGRAFASFATGALLLFVSFNETQNVTVESLQGTLNILSAEAKKWQPEETDLESRKTTYEEQLAEALANIDELQEHFAARILEKPERGEHLRSLEDQLQQVRSEVAILSESQSELLESPDDLIRHTEQILQQAKSLKKQAPQTLYRLRLLEIGLPLVLSIFSVWLTLRYPLTEARCYEIKQALTERRGGISLSTDES